MKSGSILIVDDHEVVSGGVRYFLASRFQGVSFDVAANLAQARECLETNNYNLHILDISLPDGTGIELLREVKAARKTGPVILFTGSATMLEIRQGQLAGADAMLSKADDIELLSKAVITVLDGKAFFSPSVAEVIGEIQELSLTPRMVDVLELLADGLGNKEIAHRLEMTEPTVSFHLKRLRQRLGAISNREIIKRARDLGFLN